MSKDNAVARFTPTPPEFFTVKGASYSALKALVGRRAPLTISRHRVRNRKIAVASQRLRPVDRLLVRKERYDSVQ